MEQHMLEGKLLHCLLLEEDKFDEQFVISPVKLPGDSAKKVIDKVFVKALIDGYLELSLEDLKADVLQVLQEINLHQSLKTDEQRIEKMVTDENKSYYDFLRTKGDKSVIDIETLTRAKENAAIVRQNDKINKLLSIGNPATSNELKLEAESEYQFGLRGIIDNLNIDHSNKVIYINDLKTSGKTLDDFPETIEYYKYWLQAAIYVRLVRANYPDLSNYKVKFHFVVIDRLSQPYAFEVSSVTLRDWIDRLDEILKIADYHYSNRKFELPYKYEVGNVIL
jgi:hypothetical protein